MPPVAKNIRDPKLFMEGIWDWSILNGCFGKTKIKPTDIDGFVERNGRFLVLEAKKPNITVEQGQWLTFNALRNTGYFTIIIIWGKNNIPEEIQVLWPLPFQVGNKQKADIKDLRTVVKRWFEYANKQKGFN